MNQILDYNPTGNSKQRGPSGGSSKTIKVFAILLIVFAVAIIILAGSKMIGRDRTSAASSGGQSGNTNKQVEADIQVTENESSIIVKVTNDYEIESLVYSWNEDNETEIKGQGTTELEEEIVLPAGTNSFYLKVLDTEGNETTYKNEFTAENGKDIQKPTIDVNVTDDKKLKIVATDETSIDFITYRWNEEDEVKLEANPQTPKVITTTIEIPHGSNGITVVAVDSSNNTNSFQKDYKGLTKPDVKFVLDENNQNIVMVYVSHENGIKGISGTFNGQEIRINEEDITSNEVNFPLTLSVGLNRIQISASSVDGTETTAEKEFQYNMGTTTTAPDPTVPETKPTVSVEVIEESGNVKKLRVTMSYRNKIASCQLNFNGQDYDVNISEDQSTPLTFDLPMVEGNNTIHLIVKGTDGTMTEFANNYDSGRNY